MEPALAQAFVQCQAEETGNDVGQFFIDPGLAQTMKRRTVLLLMEKYPHRMGCQAAFCKDGKEAVDRMRTENCG